MMDRPPVAAAFFAEPGPPRPPPSEEWKLNCEAEGLLSKLSVWGAPVCVGSGLGLDAEAGEGASPGGRFLGDWDKAASAPVAMVSPSLDNTLWAVQKKHVHMRKRFGIGGRELGDGEK